MVGFLSTWATDANLSRQGRRVDTGTGRNGGNGRRAGEDAEPAAQPGRGVPVARRTGRGRVLRTGEAQGEPVPGHHGRPVVHGVPVSRPVRRRPGRVPTHSAVLA